MTSEAETQLLVAVVECVDPAVIRENNKLRKIRIYQHDALKFESPSRLNDEGGDGRGGGDQLLKDTSSFYSAFTEFTVRGVILEKIGAGAARDVEEDENSNDERRRKIKSAKVELYDAHSCKFVVITESSSRTIVDRFGTRFRCNVSDLIWSSSSIVEMEEENKITNPLGDDAKEEDKPPLLTIMGRYFPYDPINGMDFAGKKICVNEIQNNQVDGTGLNVWDAAILLARYLELFPEKVCSKSVLELGSGCGLVGIAAGLLGAKEVVLTDLEYSLPLMEDNVQRNIKQVRESNCETITCRMCDWFDPTSLDTFGFSSSSKKAVVSNVVKEEESSLSLFPDVILIADCVWLEELVDPLLRTLDALAGFGTKVIVSYQRRGKDTHDKFWSGLHNTFGSVLDVDADKIFSYGLDKPNIFYLLECEK